MNDILKDGELVECDTKVAEKGLVDEKNDTLLRERLDNFLKVCFPTSYIGLFDWQKDAILKMYRLMKVHPDAKYILARGCNSVFPYFALALSFDRMYDDGNEIALSNKDCMDDVRRILLADETLL